MTSTKTIRGYELRDQIGRGGFGVVYRAYQPIVDREVAIKVILPQFVKNPDFVRSFETEAQVVARLAHPFVVPLFDYWREPDGAYLVMRYLNGGSWRQLFSPDAPVSHVRMASMLQQVAAALDAAHRAQIIHRDIKPENILLDDEGNTYLADFGIAKKIEPMTDNDRNQFRGTLAYTAPEIIQSMEISPASDIYSLGYTIHEMLTGKHVLTDAPIAAVLAWHLEVLLPEISHVPAGVNHVIQRATAKDPSARYPNAQMLAREFFEAVHQNSTTVFSSPTVNIVSNPYKGLRPFDEADARDFFGRKAIVDELIEQIATKNFLTVVGPSGSGKSSVVRAGVLPALREGVVPGSDNWFIVTMMPGSQPLQQLKTALLKVAFDPSDTLSRLLSEHETGLTEALVSVLDIQSPLLLVIDQFEEVFTLVDDEDERQHFLELLYQGVTAPNSRLKVLITLRADFYDRPLLYEHFGSLVQTTTHVVLPLKTDELQQAITSPARRVGIEFDSELIAAIVSDVRQEPGALPLLQYALTELFEHRDGNRLLLAEYQRSGGVSGALARRAEDVYQELPGDQKDIARQIFLRLVNPGEGTEDTRRRARYSELMAIHADRKQIQTVLDLFGKYRLLTFDNDIETREPTIDVAHEALIREWQRLRTWLNESRNDLRLQRMLSTLMQEWRTAERDKSFLLYGTRLAQFEEWLKTSSIAPSDEERIFLQASIEAHQQQQAIEKQRQAHELALERRARRWLQAVVGLLVVVSIVGVGVTIFVYNQSLNASRRADESNSLRLAAKSQQLLGEGDSAQALSLALESVQIDNPPQETVDNLIEMAYAPGLRHRLVTQSEPVVAVSVSPDGEYLLAAAGDSQSANQSLRQSSVNSPQGQSGPPPEQAGPPPEQGGQPGRPPQGQGGPPPGPGGPPPAGGAQAQSIPQPTPTEDVHYGLVLWNLTTYEEVAQLDDATSPFTDVVFLPQTEGGLRAVTANADGRIALWDVLNRKMLHDFSLPGMDVITLSVSEDNQLLIVGGTADAAATGGVIMLWNPQTWQEERRADLALSGLRTGQISRDGTFAVASSLDGTQVIWNTATGEEQSRFVLQLSNVRETSYRVQISPDQTLLAVTAGNAYAWLWNLEQGQLISRLPSGSTITHRALFTADSKTLILAGQDGLMRLWNLDDGVVVRELRNRQINFDSLTLNGQQAVVGTTDGTVYLWDLNPTDVLHLQDFQGQPSKRAEFVPGTQQILTFGAKREGGNYQSVLVLWDISTGQPVRVFGEGQRYLPQSLAVSADGHYALTGTVTKAPGISVIPGVSNEMILWDLTTGQEVRRFSQNDTENTLSISFDPQDSHRALATHFGDVLLWQLDTGEVIKHFSVAKRPVKVVSFLSDGKTFATADDEGTIKVWDVTTGETLHTFSLSVRMDFLCPTPDGTKALIPSSEPYELSLLDLTTGKELQHFTGHTDGILSCDISGDGQRAVTGSWDNTFILWDLASGQSLRRFTSLNAAIWDVAFSPDQTMLLSLGEGIGVTLWRSTPVTIQEAVAWIEQNRDLTAPVDSGDVSP